MSAKASRIIVFTFLGLFAISVAIIGMVYAQVSAFKETLSEFVRAQTNGDYNLEINGTAVDIRALTFKFENLKMSRTATASARGIREVAIPYLELHLGSLRSLMFGRLTVENLTIREPVIEIDGGEKKGPREKHANIAQQIVKLYPAIESLLTKFDIQSLSILRADISLRKDNRPDIRVNLVDLIMEHWDMRHLTSKSQLLLKVAGQDFDFEKAKLNFTGLQYNFRERRLTFSDFNVQSTDSLTGSHMTVSGTSMIMERLDFKDLYDNQRYTLRKAEIENPVVMGSLKLKKRDGTITEDRVVLTRLLKAAFGECSIDSAAIKNARVNLTLHRNNDSVKVDLPRVDININTFKVTNDSSTFQVGELEINVNRTEITLHNNLSLFFDKVYFGRNSDLTVTDVKILDPVKKKEIASIGKLKLESFNLLVFVFNKHFHAKNISFENARLRLVRNKHAPKEEKTRPNIKSARVDKVYLKNTSVIYENENENIAVNGLAVEVTKFKMDSMFNFQGEVKKMQFANGRFTLPKEKLESQIGNLTFDGKGIQIGTVKFKKDSLQGELYNIRAEATNEILLDYKHWKSVKIEGLILDGTLPENKKVNTVNELQASLDSLVIDHMKATLRTGKNTFSFFAEGLVGQEIQYNHQNLTWGPVAGALSKIEVSTPSVKASVSKLSLAYPDHINLSSVQFTSKDLVGNLKDLTIANIKRDSTQWSAEKISTHGVVVNQGKKPVLQSDSVLVLASGFDVSRSVPIIGTVEVFKPLVNIYKTEDESNELPKTLPQRVIIHPGRVYLPNDQLITFGTIEGDRQKNTFQSSFIHMNLEKSSLHVGPVLLREKLLTLDSFRIDANKKWYAENKLETDEINVGFYGIQVKGFTLDSVLKTRANDHLDVVLDRLALDVRRDKTMPDPPETVKPVRLEQLIHLPENIRISTVTLKDGSVRYNEISDKTGEEGLIRIEKLSADIGFDKRGYMNMKASAKLYDVGHLAVFYQTIDTASFKLKVEAGNFDLTVLNQMVVPMEAIRVKSGYLKNYTLDVTASPIEANGSAIISYNNLHLEIYKKASPDQKNIKSELITILADGIILKNKKENAMVPVSQQRMKYRSVFNYWVKSAVHGAMGAVRKGKRVKSKKV